MSGKNKTTPYQSSSKESNGDSSFSAKQGLSIAKNVAQGNGANMGVAALSKVAPWVAAVIVAAKITDKVLSTGFAHQEEYTGNYINNVNYNNFKAQVNMIFHPVQTFLSIAHQQAQYNKQNKAIMDNIKKSLVKKVCVNFRPSPSIK